LLAEVAFDFGEEPADAFGEAGDGKRVMGWRLSPRRISAPVPMRPEMAWAAVRMLA